MFRFFRAMKAAYKTYQQPDSFSKGEGFEAFVEEVLFPSSDYDLVQRTSSFQDNSRRYSEHSLQPDLLFRDRKTGRQFYVECKYRSPQYEIEAIEWAKPSQLARYRETDRKYPVYFCIGLFGSPNSPEHFFLVPLRKAPFPIFYESVLERYEVDPRYVPIRFAYLNKLLQY